MTEATPDARPPHADGHRPAARRAAASGPGPRGGPDAGRPAAPTAAPSAGRAPLDARAEIERLDRLADLLDSRFRVPVVGWRFGLDAVVGLIPGVGDVAALGPAAYLVYRAHRLGADRRTVGRMALNAGVDFAVGGIPLVGDVFDAAFKANRRNIELLKRDLASRA